MMDDVWKNICGHFFWDRPSKHIFCQILGYTTGTRGETIDGEGEIYIGSCNSVDEFPNNCDKYEHNSCYETSPTFYLICDDMENLNVTNCEGK